MQSPHKRIGDGNNTGDHEETLSGRSAHTGDGLAEDLSPFVTLFCRERATTTKEDEPTASAREKSGAESTAILACAFRVEMLLPSC